MNSNDPVAWLTRDDGDGCWYSTNFKKSDDDRPLYASPPQREWVGLTDDEKESLGRRYITTEQSAHNFIVAIEVALKVKNT